MAFFRAVLPRVAAAIVALTLAFAPALPAAAQSTTFLSGTITFSGTPVAGATVIAKGGNTTLTAVTDAKGRFTFSAVTIGTYQVDVRSPQGHASEQIDVTTAGADITLDVKPIKVIGSTVVTARPPVRGSGTDVVLNNDALTRTPAGGNFSSLLLQLPGAARGANGVVHINGDHGDINYIVDGVPIPQELNRSIGGEFDPNDAAFVEALEGAYPAQYGEKFASVINVNTRTGNGPPGYSASLGYGSFGELDSDLSYHFNIGKGNVIVAARNERSDRGLDPPNPQSPHNNFSNANQFLRYTLPTGNDFLNLTVSHAYHSYQIPNDVNGGQPANTDDTETQDDLFATLQYRHPIGDHGSFSIGPSYKRSTIRDFGDPTNDFAYGIAQYSGAPTDCANALLSTGPVVGGVVTNPVGNPAVNGGNGYINGTCGFSLFGDRTAIDIGATSDYDLRSAHHDIKAGVVTDATHVAKTYDVTLQPGNFLAPIFTPGTPDDAYTVTDNSPNIGHLTALYLQDSWKMGTAYQLDYGIRTDAFSVSSDQFDVGYGQFSPRLKLTRFFNARTSVYAYYGRFFTPFSLENVAPLAAYTLNLPLQTSVAQFDLKPQRDSVYEVGAHLGIGKTGDLGLRVMQKNATDLIDDTQVGVTNLHQDINYALGRIATQTAYYQIGLPRASRFYLSVTHTYSVNKGCETQLLAPCFGSGDDWSPADHDQRIDVSSGVSLNDLHGGFFSVTGEYGSGLSTSLNPTGGITCAGPNYTSSIGGPCKFTPHTTFDAEKGWSIGNNAIVTLKMANIFNDQYLVTYLNAQGNHYAQPRSVELGLRLKSR